MPIDVVFDVTASYLLDKNTIVIAMYRPNTKRKAFGSFINPLICVRKFNSCVFLSADFNVNFSVLDCYESTELNCLFDSLNLTIMTSGISRQERGYVSCINDNATCNDIFLETVKLSGPLSLSLGNYIEIRLS